MSDDSWYRARAIDHLQARIAELEAEKESWGNEFNAIMIMKDRVAELESWQRTAIETMESQADAYEESVVLRERVGELAELEAKLAFAHGECQRWRQDFDKQAERIVEVEAQLGIALNEYACFLETMTAINQHQGYQFTQPLMNARDCLNRIREKYTRQEYKGSGGRTDCNAVDGADSRNGSDLNCASKTEGIARPSGPSPDSPTAQVGSTLPSNAASRMQMVQELIDTNVYDDDWNVIGQKKPVISAEAARELLDFPAQDVLRSSIEGHACLRVMNPDWRCEQCEWLERAIAQQTGEDDANN